MRKRIEAQKRHEMRRSGAPSARNLDRGSFIKAWGPELKKQGRDAGQVSRETEGLRD